MMKILQTLLIILLFTPLEWEVASDTGPDPRYINQLVFAENRLVLFGGKNNDNNGFGDIWEWEDGNWIFSRNDGPSRWDHSYVYMENHDQIFLFGGRVVERIQGIEERVDLNDNWIYKNGIWKKIDVESPIPRSSHSMAVLQNKGLVILFGGRNKDEIFEDTWSFDGTNWSRMDVNGPSKRYGHTLVYDPQYKRVYLFGGYNGEKLLNDLWTFNGIEWIEIKGGLKPTPRMAHTMQFDNAGRALLFGGWDSSNAVSSDCWILVNEKWQNLNVENAPDGRLSGALGYDQINDEFILFGGSTGFDGEFLKETWKLTLN